MQMQMFWLLAKLNLAEHDKFFKFHDIVGSNSYTDRRIVNNKGSYKRCVRIYAGLKSFKATFVTLMKQV